MTRERSIVVLAALSVMGPATGALAESVIAWAYGRSATVDAFRSATLLVTLGQQIFVTIMLPSAMVPMLVRTNMDGGSAAVWDSALRWTRWLSALAFMGGLAQLWWPEWFVRQLAPGLSVEAQFRAVQYTRWIGLIYVPMVIIGVVAAVTQAFERFFVAQTAQIVINVALTAAILAGSATGRDDTLLAGVLVGYFVAAAGAATYMLNYRRMTASTEFFVVSEFRQSESSLKFVQTLLPLAMFLGLINLTSVILNRALSLAGRGEIAAFNYASKMNQFIVILPTALSVVLFPALVGKAIPERWAEFMSSSHSLLRMCLFVTIPSAAISISVSDDAAVALFVRGAFTIADAAQVAGLFRVLVLGTVAYVILATFQRIFYAADRFWTSTSLQFAILLVLWLGIGLVNIVTGLGIAAAYVAGSWTAVVLAFCYTKAWTDYRVKDILCTAGTLLVLSACLVAGSSLLIRWLVPGSSLGFAISRILLTIGFSTPGYLWVTSRLGIPEARRIRHFSAKQLSELFTGAETVRRSLQRLIVERL